MAQRRSKSRRLSRRSGNLPGFLDDNTNTIDNNDLQWYNRTILRPSTSFDLTNNASSILNPDSMVDEINLSSNWYNNLSISENSKLMEKTIKSKVNNPNNGSEENIRVEPITESESETEFQRKRTKLRINKKNVNMSDKSNMFLKALEKTTEPHTKNLIFQMPEDYESETTNDDSRTIKRIRPALFRNNKSSKENMSSIDDVFYNDSTTENVLMSKKNTRSFLKQELIEHTSTPEKRQKFKKTQLVNLVEISPAVNENNLNKSVNRTPDKTLLVTPVRELRNRSIIKSASKTPIKSSQKQAGSITIYDPVDMSLTMEENKLQKKRAVLFSKKSKTDNSKNLFDEIFDKSSSENAKKQEQKAGGVNNEPEYDESETSSIPKYIRRTRSVVLRKLSTDSRDKNIFNDATRNQRDHEKTNNNESEASHQSSKHSQDDKISQQSRRDSRNINKLHNLSPTQNKSTDNKLLNNKDKTVPNINFNEKDNESSSGSEIIDKTKADVPEEPSNDEYIFGKRQSSNSINTQTQTSILALDKSKRSKTSSNISSQKSKSVIDVNDAENSITRTSQSNMSQSQTSRNFKLNASQNSNQTLNRSIPKMRELTIPLTRCFIKSQEFQQSVESPKASYTSTESLQENQDASKFNKSKYRKSNAPLNKSKELINNSESLNVEESSRVRKNMTTTGNKSRKQISQKSKMLDTNIESNTPRKEIPSQHSLVQTSSNGTPKAKLNKKGKIINTSEELINDDYLSDDILHTPNPAQSTLKKTGKPLTRITQFLFNNNTANNVNSPQSLISTDRDPVLPSADPTISSPLHRPVLQEVEKNNEKNGDVKIDVSDDSDVSEYPMLTRHPNDIPYEAEQSTFEETAPSLNIEPLIPTEEQALVDINDKTTSTISESEWIKIKEKTDALKVMMEAQKKQQEAIEHERKREKAQIEAKLKRITAKRDAELKKQSKKPINKAYYVDGKLYKQPKLPAPKKWVTDRLYKYLWKHMESKFGIRTRVMSEKFVMKLSDVFSVVTRRKKYENYKTEVDNLMIKMAKLGLIENRYDFYEFCREFMPYSFRIKVIPMLMPGNKRNIPYEVELVYKRILPELNGSNDS